MNMRKHRIQFDITEVMNGLFMPFAILKRCYRRFFAADGIIVSTVHFWEDNKIWKTQKDQMNPEYISGEKCFLCRWKKTSTRTIFAA